MVDSLNNHKIWYEKINSSTKYQASSKISNNNSGDLGVYDNSIVSYLVYVIKTIHQSEKNFQNIILLKTI